MSEQKKAEEFGITEDDVSEIRQDINKFRFELVDILRKNSIAADFQPPQKWWFPTAEPATKYENSEMSF